MTFLPLVTDGDTHLTGRLSVQRDAPRGRDVQVFPYCSASDYLAPSARRVDHLDISSRS